MDDLHELLRARLSMIRRYLDRVLDRFTEEQFHWRPAPGLKSVAEQVLEIADKDRESIRWLETGAWPDDEPASFELDSSTLASSRKVLDEVRAATLAYLDSQSVQDLALPILCPEGWLEALGLTECPRHEVIRNIAAHEWYHTAQLVTYRGLLGDDLESW